MSRPSHDPDLNALEHALAGLVPASGLNRDALLFRAGQASARRGRAWPCAAILSTLAALVLAAVLLLRPEPQPVVRVVYVPVPVTSEPPPEPEPPPELVRDDPWAEPNYLKLRQRVLEQGVDALPAPAPWTGDPEPARRDPLLDLPPDALRDPWLRHRKTSLNSGDAS